MTGRKGLPPRTRNYNILARDSIAGESNNCLRLSAWRVRSRVRYDLSQSEAELGLWTLTDRGGPAPLSRSTRTRPTNYSNHAPRTSRFFSWRRRRDTTTPPSLPGSWCTPGSASEVVGTRRSVPFRSLLGEPGAAESTRHSSTATQSSSGEKCESIRAIGARVVVPGGPSCEMLAIFATCDVSSVLINIIPTREDHPV